jgi:23S rRNA (adenine2503-C2)-methyltransferase
MGFKRNLSSGEILGQLLLANQQKRVTNVVFMGMGEPLDNYEAVVKACKVMIHPQSFGLSKSKVTISTSGLIPEIIKLGKDLPVRLAISLHSAEDEKRSRLMPINKKYSLQELKKVLLDYPASKRYGITFEYVLIKDRNDHIEDAKKLVTFLHGLNAKVNLIPMNHFPGVEMCASDVERIKKFQQYLSERGIPAPVRYSKGVDISGGCGQLAAKRADELNSDPREIHRKRRQN